jgi:hypothetical protein
METLARIFGSVFLYLPLSFGLLYFWAIMQKSIYRVKLKA